MRANRYVTAALIGAASMALSSPLSANPAIMPSHQSGKTRGGERKVRGKRHRKARPVQGKTHMSHRGGSTKLARRLRRKFELGRSGSF